MMGQTSSQVAPLQSAPDIDTGAVPRDTIHRKRKHEKKDLSSHKENPYTSSQLSGEAANNISRSSVEDDLAASSQLVNGTYNSQVYEVSDLQGPQEKSERDHEHREKRRKTRSQPEDIPSPEDVRSSGENPLHSPRSPDAQDSLNELFEDESDEAPIQSSHKLDDIQSDDGDIASLLQDYEDLGMSSYPLNGAPETSSNLHDGNFTGALPISSPPASPSHVTTSIRNKRKGKRKRHSAPSSDVYVEEGQTWPGVTGQHSLDIDFEAFDELCAANDVGSANLFDDIPGQALPLNPVLIEGDDEPVPTVAGNVTQTEGCATPSSASKGQRRRTSSRSKSHKTKHNGDAEVPLVSNSLLFDDFPLLNEHQQDQVLPGFEDMQRQSSQEYLPSGASSAEDSVCSESVHGHTPENGYASATAPPRRKASKPDKGLVQGNRGLHYSSSPVQEVVPKDLPKGGPYSNAEITKLENYRDGYCEANDISNWQFNELVHTPSTGNDRVKDLLEGAYETLPNRTKTSLRRFCYRRFHNFSVRGVWTAEDDKLLKQAVAEKGKSWVEVGQIMGRFHEDVRDRWRNYHVNAKTRKKEIWTDIEVMNLVRAVVDCMQLMREARWKSLEVKYEGRDIPDSAIASEQAVDDSKLINWQVVSDRMGASRSRLQCSFKWAHLRDEERRHYIRKVRAARKEQAAAAAGRKAPKKPWRTVKAFRRVQQMRPGDKQELLEALSGCGALSEKNIPWQSLGGPNFKARWSTVDKKAAWQLMKENFAGADQMHYEDVVNRLMTSHMAETENLDERYDPQVHGSLDPSKQMTKAEKAESKKKKYAEKLQQKKEKRKVANAEKPYKARQFKSEYFVEESDQDEADQSATNIEDLGSITQSNSNSRRSSDALWTRGGDEDLGRAGTADTSVNGYDEEELPRSERV